MRPPEINEYNPYALKYIQLTISEGADFMEVLHKNTEAIINAFKSLSPELHNYQYAQGKWTLKEVLMHLIDTERVFGFRAFVCIRGDNEMPLHSMDENKYAANAIVVHRSMDSLIEEFKAVRKNTTFLFSDITEEQSSFLGNGIPFKISARALGYMIVGHAIHHLQVIRERYLSE